MKDTLTAKLANKCGCLACKHQITDDDFLTASARFWCAKQKQSFAAVDVPYQDCPSWTLNGDEDMLKSINQPKLPE